MSDREIVYLLLHGDDGDSLAEKVNEYLMKPVVTYATPFSSRKEYWKVNGAPFYAHAGVAQSLIKVQEITYVKR